MVNVRAYNKSEMYELIFGIILHPSFVHDHLLFQPLSNYNPPEYFYPSKATLMDYKVILTTLATAGR